MLELSEFKRAGRFDKATSWIVDPIRSLACSFLWPYFKRLLIEIDQSAANTRKEALAAQSEHALARQMEINSRVGGMQKDMAATAMRLASVEKLLIETKTFFTEYTEKRLQLDDGFKVALPGSSLVLAAVKYGRFLLRQPDLISRAIIDGQYWDPHLKPIIETSGRQDLLAIDAGSYFGFHSVYMARYFGQVYAFEPQTEIFQMLCANILINGMRNIKAFNNALYERECYMGIAPASMQEIPVPYIDGTVDYNRIENAAALSFAPADENALGAVRGLTIDSLNLENVGFIKLDTQGY